MGKQLDTLRPSLYRQSLTLLNADNKNLYQNQMNNRKTQITIHNAHTKNNIKQNINSTHTVETDIPHNTENLVKVSFMLSSQKHIEPIVQLRRLSNAYSTSCQMQVQSVNRRQNVHCFTAQMIRDKCCTQHLF